jgi:hypothetical protein
MVLLLLLVEYHSVGASFIIKVSFCRQCLHRYYSLSF